ncbi:uncharacterized protein V6R79_025197 [Siganus canaliculatus]
MSYAKLTSARLAGSVPLMKGHEHGDTLSDDDDWQSPQPLKQLKPPPPHGSNGVSALNKSVVELQFVSPVFEATPLSMCRDEAMFIVLQIKTTGGNV